jgi:competence protein ComEA
MSDEPKMFRFDPNTLDESGWKRLGLRDKTAATITRYLAKGGRFREPDDLLKIYGLRESDKARLLPYVSIQSGTAATRTETHRLPLRDAHPSINAIQEASGTSIGQARYTRKSFHDIDINNADSSEWRTLPGIGATLSLRIIKYREKLGGFYRADQVAEVFGLQDSIYQSIRPYLVCKAETGKISINEATREQLEQHPYLKRPLARAIIDYRSQHGLFKDLEDLKNLIMITPDLFNRIAPYLSL